ASPAGRTGSGTGSGVDTPPDAPLAVGDQLRKPLIKRTQAKTPRQRLKLVGSIRPAQLAPDQPSNGEPRTGLSMGDHAAITAREMNITREEQDECAATSHQSLAKAYDEGFFEDLSTPSPGVQRDTD